MKFFLLIIFFGILGSCIPCFSQNNKADTFCLHNWGLFGNGALIFRPDSTFVERFNGCISNRLNFGRWRKNCDEITTVLFPITSVKLRTDIAWNGDIVDSNVVFEVRDKYGYPISFYRIFFSTDSDYFWLYTDRSGILWVPLAKYKSYYTETERNNLQYDQNEFDIGHYLDPKIKKVFITLLPSENTDEINQIRRDFFIQGNNLTDRQSGKLYIRK